MVPTRRWLITIGVLAALAGCSSLGTLNTVNAITPGDGGVRQVGADIAFGPDPRQKLDIYAPDNAKAAPVLVFFYGGSWSSGRRQDYAFAAKALAARGFIVVVPDYRLVPQVRYPAFIEDGAAAVAWTSEYIARYQGDPARIGVIGHSAGAYIALMLALDRRWLIAAGAPDAIKAAVGLAGPYDFAPFEPGGAAQAAFGREPDPRVTQPVNSARKDAPPVLLLSGSDDTTVRPRNATALAAALGRPGAVKLYPGIGHIGIILAVSKPFRGKAPVLADATGFFHREL
ncbi:carboxylesterase [Polymorphobacter glacialis]|uniref:Carboxylesterase n=1 Tax=Sandarakinorhabdus glacialis TaxID=1614636 RepID=A0A916ZTE6_9SPHN|nr:alpha/beta hydrolase [Polymorphobacter glacialis]GGE13355.1 carboxylesterase [Polymorphobacter glacialis]